MNQDLISINSDKEREESRYMKPIGKLKNNPKPEDDQQDNELESDQVFKQKIGGTRPLIGNSLANS